MFEYINFTRWLLSILALAALLMGFAALLRHLSTAAENTASPASALAKRWQKLLKHLQKNIPKRRLTVLETTSLGVKHKLVLVKKENTEYLLLLSPEGGTLLEKSTAQTAAGTHPTTTVLSTAKSKKA